MTRHDKVTIYCEIHEKYFEQRLNIHLKGYVGCKNICFGYVVSPFGAELGYFSLEEIKGIKGSLKMGVERDLSFKPTRLSIIKKAS